MKITFVRHGETEEGDKGIYQYDNVHLSAKGREQSKKLAERLKNEKFDCIYCSTLSRAKETAEEIIKFHKNTPIKFVDELRELRLGIMEGKPYDTDNDLLSKDYLNFKPKGGESRLEFLGRVKEFLDSLYKKHKGHILLIAHTGISRRLNNIINNKLPDYKDRNDFQQDNCCVNIIEFENGKPRFKLLNCTKHLR